MMKNRRALPAILFVFAAMNLASVSPLAAKASPPQMKLPFTPGWYVYGGDSKKCNPSDDGENYSKLTASGFEDEGVRTIAIVPHGPGRYAVTQRAFGEGGGSERFVQEYREVSPGVIETRGLSGLDADSARPQLYALCSIARVPAYLRTHH